MRIWTSGTLLALEYQSLCEPWSSTRQNTCTKMDLLRKRGYESMLSYYLKDRPQIHRIAGRRFAAR